MLERTANPDSKCAILSGPAEKATGIAAFGGQASGFGSGMQTGFSFSNAQTNAASSTGIPQGTSLFSAGAGSTNTGQFSFNVGAGSQSNAAAASAFASDPPATSLPTQGRCSDSGKKCWRLWSLLTHSAPGCPSHAAVGPSFALARNPRPPSSGWLADAPYWHLGLCE